MSGQLVVFATPAFDHNVTVEYAQSMMEADWLLAKHNIPRGYEFIGGDPYLAKVRNLCVARAIRQYPMLTDFFFIDADVSYPADAVLRFLQSDVDVIAGIYPKKNDSLEFPAFLEMTDDKEFIVKNGLYMATGVPTGFLRIKRHVLDKMAAASGQYTDGTGHGELTANIFEMGYCPDNEKDAGKGEWWGEDFAWSRKWRQMGGELWIDPDIDFGHRGQKTWKANFKTQGIDAAIRDGKAKHRPAVEAHEDDFMQFENAERADRWAAE